MATKETEKERKAIDIVDTIIVETKLNITKRILDEIFDYDGRFDVPHVIHLEHIIINVMTIQPSDQFVSDMADIILKKE